MHQEDDANRSAGSPKAACCGKDGGQSGGKALVPRFFGITFHQLCSREFGKLLKTGLSVHPLRNTKDFTNTNTNYPL